MSSVLLLLQDPIQDIILHLFVMPPETPLGSDCLRLLALMTLSTGQRYWKMSHCWNTSDFFSWLDWSYRFCRGRPERLSAIIITSVWCFITYFSLKNISKTYFLFTAWICSCLNGDNNILVYGCGKIHLTSHLLLDTIVFLLLQQMLHYRYIGANILADLSGDFLRLNPELWESAEVNCIHLLLLLKVLDTQYHRVLQKTCYQFQLLAMVFQCSVSLASS